MATMLDRGLGDGREGDECGDEDSGGIHRIGRVGRKGEWGGTESLKASTKDTKETEIRFEIYHEQRSRLLPTLYCRPFLGTNSCHGPESCAGLHAPHHDHNILQGSTMTMRDGICRFRREIVKTHLTNSLTRIRRRIDFGRFRVAL